MDNQNPILTLSPDKKKVLALNAIKIIFVASVFIGISIYLNEIGTLENALFVFEMFGTKVDTSKIVGYLISGIVAVSLVSIILIFLNYAGRRCAFYGSFLIKHRKTGEKQIPYDSILSVSFNKQGVSNKLFNIGTINITLNDESKDKIEYVDDPEQAHAQIQSIMNNYKMKRYSQFEQQGRVENILERF